MSAITASSIKGPDVQAFTKVKHYPIDPSQLKLDEKALTFFRVSICDDLNTMKQRILDVQKECV